MYTERHAAEENGKADVDLRTPDIKKIYGNYLLSCKCLTENSIYPIPPNTSDITPRTDYIALADELFLGMVAFCLLHEIAHLESGDSITDEEGAPLNNIEPHQMEFAADKWAYDWILTLWRQSSADPKVFVKRTLGIIFSLSMMDEFRHHQNRALASSHPQACDRLIQFFNDYGEQIHENEWGYTCFSAVFVGLQAIAIKNGYVLPTEGFSDPLSFLNLAKTMPQLASEANAQGAKCECMQALGNEPAATQRQISDDYSPPNQ